MLWKSDEKMRTKERLQFEAEAARQFALERYDVLDSAAEDCFDHITEAVKSTLDVPSVAISFLDGKRQWFKSKIGVMKSEGPRDVSFCDLAVDQMGSMVVEDTLEDVRFRENPAVIGSPFFRSYIGIPLKTPDGHNIGTLCAADIIPRKFSAEKIERVAQLAELVIHELELRQQSKKDRLTGTLTRSGFSVEVQKAISLHERQDIKSTLVVFDVDLYRMVSQRCGDSSGKELLRSIIKPLVGRLRRSDCIGRLGGTQFAILLTCTTEAKARRATAAMQREVEQMNTEVFFDVSFCEISSNMGVCDDWLEQANNNLLAAKKVGGYEAEADTDRQYNWAS
tara:strand:+ start:1268 stop:2281 length:1014 start_codon:yes stop_codon:yes gene_type:complete